MNAVDGAVKLSKETVKQTMSFARSSIENMKTRAIGGKKDGMAMYEVERSLYNINNEQIDILESDLQYLT